MVIFLFGHIEEAKALLDSFCERERPVFRKGDRNILPLMQYKKQELYNEKSKKQYHSPGCFSAAWMCVAFFCSPARSSPGAGNGIYAGPRR
jgi:hypothetical protein